MATISGGPALRRKLRVEVLDEEMARVLSAKTGAERLAIAAGMFRSARRMITGQLHQAHIDIVVQLSSDRIDDLVNAFPKLDQLPFEANPSRRSD